VTDIVDALKRLLVGRPVRSDSIGHTLLPKRIALPVFASDALSSVAYAPDEILLTLSLAGLTAATISPWVGLAVVVVMAVVVSSYRQNVHAYPSGGGDYEVATVNLGPTAGLTVASALLIDYVLTVAVSISAGTQYAAAAIPSLHGREVPLALLIIAVLTLINLRGVRESGVFFAIPTYLFMASMGALIITGVIRTLTGTLPLAESAGLDVVPIDQFDAGLAGLAGGFLVLRAFSSGCAALTGVEAISNGVPMFRAPKSRNAASTLLMLGLISITMMTAILWLAKSAHVRFVEEPHLQLLRGGELVPEDYNQNPVIGQLARSVFDGFPIGFYVITVVTGLVLILAANTAFNGFPMLGSILARDGFLPRQLHTRGDRLAFSNGIIALAAGAMVLVWAFDAEVTKLIQLYIVGVFVSFTLSQWGMVRHWTRLLRTEVSHQARSRMKRSRVINAVGFGMTSVVLVVVLITKFTRGAWIAILAMLVIFFMMRAIRRHYDAVSEELSLVTQASSARALPASVHAIVLVSKLHKPTMRAIAYARATRPSTIEALSVVEDEERAADFTNAWAALDLPIPLRLIESPYREVTRPIVAYVRSIHRRSPRDLIVVYVPEYVVGHWWEHLLHNQTALRLKSRLLFIPGVVMASVPWQLRSSELAAAGELQAEGAEVAEVAAERLRDE